MPTKPFRAGTVALIGRPNVGKSTLLNRILGVHLSPVSRKAQTTRQPITGILTQDKTQYIFLDTPGLQTKNPQRLSKGLNQMMRSTTAGADVVLCMIEAKGLQAGDKRVFQEISEKQPALLLINKIDHLNDKNQLLPMMAALSGENQFKEIIPLSAEKGTQCEVLLEIIQRYLPECDQLYDEAELTTLSERVLASEFIREQIFRLTGDEIPYSAHVMIREFEMVGNLRRITADILVSRANHKAIIIGKKGERLKQIGSQARMRLEELLGGPIYLSLWVKVQTGWSENPQLLKQFGYSL